MKILILLLFSLYYTRLSLAQTPPSIGYTCSANHSTYPCQTYAFFRASGPTYLDLGSIGDLFSISRLMISNPSNILSPTLSLLPNQPLFIPLSCGCNFINATITISFANLTFTIRKGDTFYHVSTYLYQNLTTYQSVQVVNPTLIPTQLKIGDDAVFPIFCKCPNISQVKKQINYLISYVFQPTDNLSYIASFFGSTIESIIKVNGDHDINPFETIFIPVSSLPKLKQSNAYLSTPSSGRRDKKTVLGLGIALGICGILLVIIVGVFAYRERFVRRVELRDNTKEGKVRRDNWEEKEANVNLIANVSDCLDKYIVYRIEELRVATDGFDQKWLIKGNVYEGCIDGGIVAIKKMKWNACEELKILQKLEGFCIEPEDANCYLVYEYVENGSLNSYLHEKNKQKLNWKSRVKIAIDVANDLQYIHEHTTPRVVHKDIKSTNILLDANMRAKIANFGLAKSGCNAITMKIVGTQGYIAPEYLSNGVISTKTDVFSFGVVLLELLSGREAIDMNGNILWNIVDGFFEGSDEMKKKRLLSWIDNVLLQESCSIEGVMNVMNVALSCLNRDPFKRPNMVDIAYALCKSDDLFSDNSNDVFSPRVVTAR